MAVFGIDFYGLSKYGARPAVDYGVDPFVAEATNYSTVLLTWTAPGGNWSKFRLLRNRRGYSINEVDGEILLDSLTAAGVPTRAVDDRQSGGWNYYAIFLYNPTQQRWERASVTSVLVPFDYSSTEKLLSMIPEYYRLVRDNAAGFSASQYEINPQIYLSSSDTLENEALERWIACFGWGFDVVRSHIEATFDGYDPDVVHVNRLALLADQFGATLEPSVPTHNNRNLVKNLALLYRKKGTLSGIREVLSLSSGWDVEVLPGDNLMLNLDQSEFATPVVQEWNPNTRYVQDDYVLYGRWYFRAVQTAYGPDQPPAENRSNNTWWNATEFASIKQVTDTINPDTGDVGSWQVFNANQNAVTAGVTAVGMGVVDPLNPSGANTNALTFRNTDASASNLVARSIPSKPGAINSYDRQFVLENGIPLPRVVNNYDPGYHYAGGDRVLFKGVAYEAFGVVEGVPPTDTTKWKRLGYDNRVRVNISYYIHGPFSGTYPTGFGAVTSTPYVAVFDEKGDFISEHFADLYASVVAFDTFSVNTNTVTPGRVMEVSLLSWSSQGIGDWPIQSDDSGFFATPLSMSRTFRTVNYGSANASVAVTMKYLRQRELGLVFRVQDNSNFWAATNKKLLKVSAGTTTTRGVYSREVKEGERLQVTTAGNLITIKVGDETLLSVTDTFLNAATTFGIFGEATT